MHALGQGAPTQGSGNQTTEEHRRTMTGYIGALEK